MHTQTTVDAYIQSFPKNVQEILNKMKKTIKKAAPQSEELISYGIPTYKLNGNLVHFGGYAKHIGFYPGSEAIEVFKDKLTKYKCSKGTVQFSLEAPIPYDLVTEITTFRVKKNLAKKSKAHNK